MKAKTIKAIIRKKVNDWLKSISDERVRLLAAKHTIVTGGCIASMLLQEDINDYDIYFRNEETAMSIAAYYIRKYNTQTNKLPAGISNEGGRIKVVIKSAGLSNTDQAERGYRYFEGDLDPNNTDAGEYVEIAMAAAKKARSQAGYIPIYLSSNAITLSGDIQLVLRFYGEACEIHKNYDFVHCTNYWDVASGQLVLHPAALESLLARELRYEGSLYPVCSVIRTRKFVARGWTINAGQYLKMAMQISALDLTNVSVLEEQLTGVDTAYFAEVIGLLKAKTGEDKPIDNAYLIEIIDRMF